MIVTEKVIHSLIKEKEEIVEMEQISTIYFESMNINGINIRTRFENIEFLSLQNNNIADINFLKFLPKIWYLDISNNPIENYDMINTINTFGFLGLSIEKYSEKKILSIKKINVGILQLMPEEENLKNYFLLNSPNIIRFNEEVVYYSERISILNSTYGNGSTSTPNSFTNKNSGEVLHSFKSLATIKNLANIYKKQFTGNVLNSQLSTPIHGNIMSNTKKKNLYTFFENFNKVINGLAVNPLSILTNDNLEAFLEDTAYLKEEKKKLIMLCKISQSIAILNQNSKNILNANNKNSDNFGKVNLHMIKQFCNYQILKVSDVFLQILILIIIILYILQVTGKEISIVMLKYIYKNYLSMYSVRTNDIKSILEMEIEFLLGIYYDVYDHFLGIYNKGNPGPRESDTNILNLDKIKYQEIKKNLEMQNMVLKCNALNEFKLNASKIFLQKNELESRKVLINVLLIKQLDEKLKVFNEILKLIQYLSDFIIFNKIDTILLNDHTFQYRIFIEIRGLMFSYLNRKTKENTIYNTLADRRFEAHNYKRFGNKLYFIKHPLTNDKIEKSTNNIFDFLGGVKTKNKKIRIVKSRETSKNKADLQDSENYKLIPRIKLEKTQQDFLSSKSKFKDTHHSNSDYNSIGFYSVNKSEPEQPYSSTTSGTLFKTLIPTKKDKQNYHLNFSNDVSEGNSISPLEIDSLLRTTRLTIKNEGFKHRKINSEILTNKTPSKIQSSDNDLKCLLDDDVLKLYVKLLIKKDQYKEINPKKIKHRKVASESSSKLAKVKYNLSMSSTSRYNIQPFNSNKSSYTNINESKYLTYSSNVKTPKSKITPFINEEESAKNLNSKHFFSPISEKVNKTSIDQMMKKFKNAYDFKSNIKKLTHHWNQNNPKATQLLSNEVKEDEFQKLFNKTKNVSHNAEQSNYTSAEDIYNLFAIHNKNDDIKDLTKDIKSKKYTIKVKDKNI